MPYYFKQLPGARMHCRLKGEPSNPTIVLSNSLGTDLRMWEPQMEVLAAKYQVVSYDTRGHGQSSVPAGPYSLEQLGNDVISLLDDLGIERFSFCGLSMGGLTGMWLALAHGDRMDKLILSNTSAYIGPPENWNTRVQTVLQDGMEAIADKVLAIWLTAQRINADPALAARMREMLVATPAKGYAANCLAIRDSDLRLKVGGIKVPTLVISGNADMATPPADGRFLAEKIDASRYVQIEAAHLSNLERPENFNKAVMEFLAR